MRNLTSLQSDTVARFGERTRNRRARAHGIAIRWEVRHTARSGELHQEVRCEQVHAHRRVHFAMTVISDFIEQFKSVIELVVGSSVISAAVAMGVAFVAMLDQVDAGGVALLVATGLTWLVPFRHHIVGDAPSLVKSLAFFFIVFYVAGIILLITGCAAYYTHPRLWKFALMYYCFFGFLEAFNVFIVRLPSDENTNREIERLQSELQRRLAPPPLPPKAASQRQLRQRR